MNKILKYRKQLHDFKSFEEKINRFNLINTSPEKNIIFSKKIIIESKKININLLKGVFNLDEPIGIKIYRNCMINYLNKNYYAVFDGIPFIEYYYQLKSKENNISISKLDKSGQDSYSESYYTLSTILDRLKNNNISIDSFDYYLFSNNEGCLNLRNKFAHGEIRNNFALYSTYILMSISKILMRSK